MVMRKEIDIFSHRTHLSYDVFSLQYNLIKEDMVRQNYGEVLWQRLHVKLESGDIQDIFDKIKKDYICKTSFISNNEQYCLSSLYNIFYFSRKNKTKSDYYDENEPYVVQEQKELEDSSEFDFELCTKDKNLFKDIKQKLTEYGFKIINSFSYQGGFVPITFAYLKPDGIVYNTHEFDKVPFASIKQNYETNVINKIEKLFKQLEDTQNGIVVLHGIQGSGKTWLVRSILTEMKKRRAVVCSPPMVFLNDAGKLDNVMSNFKKSLLVFEDIGDLLTMDSSSNHIDARANLLNVSEGLLSLVADSIILITFNTDIKKIDPAIIRPGRCLANIEVGNLSFEHSQKLVGDIKLSKREYTLAEIYQIKNGEDPNSLNEVKGKMGF